MEYWRYHWRPKQAGGIIVMGIRITIMTMGMVIRIIIVTEKDTSTNTSANVIMAVTIVLIIRPDGLITINRIIRRNRLMVMAVTTTRQRQHMVIHRKG